MTKIGDLRTGAKLTLSFGLMAILIGVVGLQGIHGMARMHERLTELYEKEALGVSHIKEAYVNAVATQSAVRAALLHNQADKWQAQAEEREARFRREFEKYRKTLVHPEDIAKANEAATLFTAMREAQDAIFGLVKSGAGDYARGRLTVVDSMFDALDQTVDQLSRRKATTMEQTAEETWSVYIERRRAVIIVVGSALAAAAVLGVMITRMTTRPLGRAVRLLESVAGGDFTKRLEVTSRDEVGRMAAALSQALDSVSEALREVSAAAEGTAAASRQLSASVAHMSVGAQEQASSLEETAASLEEITGTLKRTADNAVRASHLADGSRAVAEKGGQIVVSTVQAMGEIRAASRRIAEISSTIDALAFQTNLLALNAAVEAGRAGQQAPGFLIVATEVRKLAQQSATAAKEIKDLIQDSVTKIETGSAWVDQAGEALTEIVHSARQVAAIVSEIAAASQEQSGGVDQINRAVAQMDQVTQSNAAQTEEIASTAETLANRSARLQALVARFKLDLRNDDRAASGAPEQGARSPRSPNREAATAHS